MKRQRQAALFELAINAHEHVLVDARVALAGDHEPDHTRRFAELLDHLQARIGIVKRKAQQRLHALLARQDCLREPAVVGERHRRDDVRIRMQAHLEHRLREHHLHLDSHRIHGAPHQRQIAVFVRLLHVLAELRLVRDAAKHILKRQPNRMIAERQLLRVRPVLRHRYRVVPQDGILEVLQNFGPGIEFHVMRVHVHDEIVVEVQAGDVAARVRQDFARVGARRNLLDFVLARAAHARFRANVHFGFAHRRVLARNLPRNANNFQRAFGVVRENQSARSKGFMCCVRSSAQATTIACGRKPERRSKGFMCCARSRAQATTIASVVETVESIAGISASSSSAYAA